MKSKLEMMAPERKMDLRLIGPFYGIVMDNKDPKKEGRITVKVPELFGIKKLELVPPFMTAHEWEIPRKGQHTKIQFRNLDIDQPYWEGAWWPKEKYPPDVSGDPDHHVKQVTNEKNKALYTHQYRRGEKAQIRVNDDNDTNNQRFILEYTYDGRLLIEVTQAGSYIEIDEASGEVRIWSDKLPNGAESAPITLNCDAATGRPVARKFDKVIVLDPTTGAPIMQGLIMEGTPRVKADPFKAQ